jgi:uncharacterized membrane protein YqjE
VTEGDSGTPGGAAEPPKPPPDPGTTPEPEVPSAGSSNGESPEDMTVGELVFEISDRASVLIREEVELAKTEVTEKLNRLLQGSVVGLVAGVFVLMALAMIMHGVAWLLNDLFFGDNVWAGFLVEAAFLLLLAAAGGFFAYRSFKKSSPPLPEMAIEEAKEIKATFDKEESS